MGDLNYEKVLEKIAKSANLDKEEVRRMVGAKRAKLSDLISYEGAAQIVAAELGISFENEKMKIEELLPGMRKANVSGKIINLFPVRTFKNNKGIESKVANFILADSTSNIKVVLWDTNHIELIESGKLKIGNSIEIGNASVRENEIHLGNFSTLKPSEEVFENVISERVIKEKPISDFSVSDNAKARAFIVQSFEPRFFHVCSQCKKKVATDEENYICLDHGKVIPEKRALINLVLDDGTGTIRSVLFHDSLTALGITSLDDIEKLIAQKEDLLGKEMIFSGNVRMNKFFNEPEFIVDKVNPVNLDELIVELGK